MPTNPGATDLVSWWSLDEASGTRADAHGSNDLTPINAPASASGKVGDAVDLESGSDQYLTIAAGSQSGLAAGAAGFAFGAWYRMESAASAFICSKRDSGAAEFTMTTNADSPGALHFYLAPGFSPLIVVGSLPVGGWVFVVVGYDVASGNACISINGAAPTTGARAFGGAASAPFSIGYDLSGGLPKWDGLVDQAFYYTRWLTDDELAWLYNAGAGRSYADVAGGGAVASIVQAHGLYLGAGLGGF